MTEHWIKLDGYKVPDPTTKRFAEATYKARYSPEDLTRDQGFQLAEVAEFYHMLLTHPAGTEAMIKKVRAARAALKERKRTAV